MKKIHGYTELQLLEKATHRVLDKFRSVVESERLDILHEIEALIDERLQ